MPGSDDLENVDRGDNWSSDLTALDSGERKRRALLTEWFQVGICEILERSDGYAFWLDPNCHIANHVEEFAALEQRCHPFLQFRVRTDAEHDGPVLEASGPKGAKDFMASHYGIRGQAGQPVAPVVDRSDDDKPTDWNDGDDLEDDDFGLWEGKCQACDAYGRVSDMSLCEECAGKIERDFIRKREWAYSATAFGCPEENLEALRTEIIRSYGEHLELLAEDEKPSKRPKRERRK